MGLMYTENYAYTGYTYATKQFILESTRKKLPKEIIGKDLKEISKIIGIDLENVESLDITYKDRSKIRYRWDPLDDEPAIEVRGQEFVRFWYYRRKKWYIHRKYSNIQYLDGAIVLTPGENFELYKITIPENFPVDDWETLSKEPEKELFPHVDPQHVIRQKITKNKLFIIEVDAPTKRFRTSIKKTKKYFIYRNVPFAEGIYDVKVPKTLDEHILCKLSVKELPDSVKLTTRKALTDKIKVMPEKIKYENGEIYFKYSEYTLNYVFSTNEMYIFTPKDGWTAINGADGRMLFVEAVQQEDPLAFIKTVMGLM